EPPGSDPEQADPFLAVAGRQVRESEVEDLPDLRLGGHPPHRSGPTDRDVARPGGEIRDEPAVRWVDRGPQRRRLAEVSPGEIAEVVGEERLGEGRERADPLEWFGREPERFLCEALRLLDDEPATCVFRRALEPV